MIWNSDEMSVPRFFVLSHHNSEYVKRENIIFPLFYLHYWILNTKKHKKIVGERTLTFCVLSYRHDNFYCIGMVIFSLRIIFFGVLRKCYKITVPHSNFYLEFPYSLWRIFFSVYLYSLSQKKLLNFDLFLPFRWVCPLKENSAPTGIFGYCHDAQCGNLIFFGHSEDFSHTFLCYYYACGNMRLIDNSNNSHTMDFYTDLLFVLKTIGNYTTQCGENRYTGIINFASY